MNYRKITISLLLITMVWSGLAAELELSSDEMFYSTGDNISFNVTAEPGNYTVSFSGQDFERDFTLEPLNNSNTTKKTLNFTLSQIVFNSYVEASIVNESARTESFYVGTGDPVFESVSVSPEFLSAGDIARVSARVSDSDLDVEGARLQANWTNGTLFQGSMVESEDERPFYSFNAGFSVGDEPKNVELTLEAYSNSSNSTYRSTFEVYPEGTTGDRSDINAAVSNPCGLEVDPYVSPGGGLLPAKGTGSFLIGFERDGGYAVNVSSRLEVYYEGNFSELNDDDPGIKMNMSYPPMVTDRPITTSSNEFYRVYNKTSEYGYYRGLLKVNGSCYRKVLDEEYFEDIDIEATQDRLYDLRPGSPDDDPYLNFTENVTFRVAVPGGGNGTRGSPTGNQTNPADSTQPGEESDQQVEGDSPAPGVTPEPDPVPEPTPEPRPMLSIDIRETENVYDAPRGRYSPIELTIANRGNVSLTDIQISPLLGGLGSWGTRSASIGNLSQGEVVNRTVFLRPPDDLETKQYRVPVLARGQEDQRELDLQYVDVKVKQANFSRRIGISEIPDRVTVSASSSIEIPVLINNTGRRNATNVTLEVQNIEQCGEILSDGPVSIPVNNTKSLQLQLNSSNNLGVCNTTVIASTQSGIYTFSDLSVEVTPEEGLIPPRFRVPLIAIVWTLGLIAYAVARRRMEMNSMMVKGPFVIMVMGEALILLYLASQYYSVIPSGILPF